MSSAITFGPLTFLAPLTLLGLIILPLIWWLLRVTPPKPLQQIFPPLRILQDVHSEEETPNSTPLWLLLFRLALVSLICFALAKPLLMKADGIETNPSILIIDNSWDAAPNWSKIISEAENRVLDARRKSMDVMVLPTISEDTNHEFINPSDALNIIKHLKPMPLKNDMAKTLNILNKVPLSNVDLYWLSSGVYTQTIASDQLKATFAKAQNQYLMLPDNQTLPIIPGSLSETVDGFRTIWHRAYSQAIHSTDITAHTNDGRIIARTPITFAIGQTQTEGHIELPSELRSRISALRAADSPSAGSTLLLDDNWGRPLIGVLSQGQNSGNPLLSESFYAQTALKPYADVYLGTLDDILELSPTIIIMPDVARTSSPKLKPFIENGGLLIRFAGPKLVKRPDPYIPVELRQGGRALGGALTWEKAQNIAPFTPDSPFFGLTIPDDIAIKRQIMAQPGVETDNRTWARLEDGSPIITHKEMGFGRIVLFHFTASPEWSNIPVSGLYVDMLRRLLTLAKSTTTQSETSHADWAPERVLNGYGHLINPDIFAESVPYTKFDTIEPSTIHPPGFYRQGARRGALNIKTNADHYKALKDTPLITKEMSPRAYGETINNNLEGRLLSFALILLILDIIFALYVSGRLHKLRQKLPFNRQHITLLAFLISGCFISTTSEAQSTEYFDEALTLHLAYIKTGNVRVDRMSETALKGLAYELNRRTTIEPQGVRGVDPEKDNLLFYPFLYWPITRDAQPPSEKTITNLNAFMASGGTIIFDTQDSGDHVLHMGNPHPGLKRVTDKLDIPTLIEVPEDHVLNKSYYLLKLYPGRWANGSVWVDQNQNGAARDGVSSVIIGSNDWAAAWSIDDNGRPIVELEKDIARQREIAYRFGINLTMYTLAGNYKADQVHAKALIERQGLQDRQVRELDDETDE